MLPHQLRLARDLLTTRGLVDLLSMSVNIYCLRELESLFDDSSKSFCAAPHNAHVPLGKSRF